MMDLVPYEAFAAELHGGLRRRTLERMSASGDFPPMMRWSRHSPPQWSLSAVRQWIADKLAPLDAA
jgi:predicted DNA-binding transcriptional regulator AlpA